MKAVILNGYHKNGGALTICDIPVPEIEDHEVLVKIKAAGVNPLDNMIIRGEVKRIVPYKFPLIMGNEFCGVVDKVGKRFLKSVSLSHKTGTDRLFIQRVDACFLCDMG